MAGTVAATLIFSTKKRDEDALVAYEASHSEVKQARQVLHYKRVGTRFLSSEYEAGTQRHVLLEEEFRSLEGMLCGIIFMLCLTDDDDFKQN